MANGYFTIFINDELKAVPRGLNLMNLKKGDSIKLFIKDHFYYMQLLDN